MTTEKPAPAITLGRYYPQMPPALPGETSDQYTDRLTGADKTGRRPYDHARNRQCSIGYHDECSDPDGETCKCPCHTTQAPNPRHDDPTLFALVRDVDETGVSGVGTVAHGVEFADGTCVLRWLTEHSSTAVYEDAETLEAIHGHGGKTRIVWIDPNPPAPADAPEAPALLLPAAVITALKQIIADADYDTHKMLEGDESGVDEYPAVAAAFVRAYEAALASPAGGEGK